MPFPSNPTPGQTHTEDNTTWVYAGPVNGWYRQSVSPGNSSDFQSGENGGGAATNLSYTASTRLLSSSTGSDVTLPLFSSSNAGLTPSSGGGTTNFLRADGSWASPPGGGGGGTPGGSDTHVQFNDGSAFGGVSDLTYNKSTKVLTNKGDVNLDDGGSFTTTLQCVTPTANRVLSLPDATGTVALVAGSSGQVVYNNAGAYGGVSTMTFDGTSVTLAGRLINSYTSLASSPAKVFTGTWFTGGTATTTKPHFLIEPTGTTSTGWSTSGTGLGVNAASGFAGRLIDLQLNGSSCFQYGVGVATSTGLQLGEGPSVSFTNSTNGRLLLHSTYTVGWAPGGGGLGANPDLSLARDAANTLAQRNGTNAQTFRVYNTFTDASNYERGKLEWASNTFRIGTQSAGTGTARPMALRTGNADRLVVDTIGSLQVATALTVATLPGTPAVGMIARVTDASAPAVGSTVAGGGAANALVWYNGTNWTVLGV